MHKHTANMISTCKLLLLIMEKKTEAINGFLTERTRGKTNKEANASLARAIGKSGGLGGSE